MKKIYFGFSLLLTVALAHAQSNTEIRKIAPNSAIRSQNPTPPSNTYYGEPVFGKMDCITQKETDDIQLQIKQNVAALEKKNNVTYGKRSMVHPLFIWPTRPKAGFTDYGYYTVQNLIDHDPLYPNHVLDYNCGPRTYDWGTGNHAGTDIIYWPYAWRKMDDQVMEVVAAAPGVIVNKVDGNFDRNCNNNGASNWNSIYVMHDDGSVTWYLHFKSGTLTTKGIGDSVAVGEYLGAAGSSGGSDWPHVHFQVMDANGSVIDPWDGSCNNFNGGDTWWQAQQPYEVSSVNRICTKSTEVDYYSCPNAEITYEKDTFNIGDSLWLWVYTRDMALNSQMQINIYSPTNQNLINWNFTVPWPTNPTSYVRWYYLVDPWWIPGNWTFETVYGGNTYQHTFYMTQSATGIAEQQSRNILSVLPNPSAGEVEIKTTGLSTGDVISITDMLGHQVSEHIVKEEIAVVKLSLSNLKNGIYFVNIKNQKWFATRKLVVEK